MDLLAGLAALLQGLGSGIGGERTARANRLRRQQRLLRAVAQGRTVTFPGGVEGAAGSHAGSSRVVVTPWAVRVVEGPERVVRQEALAALTVDGVPRSGAGGAPSSPDALTLVGPDGPLVVHAHVEYLGVLAHAVRRAGGPGSGRPGGAPGDRAPA